MKLLLQIAFLTFLNFSFVYADCPVHEGQPGRCLSAYYTGIDFNNDGIFESAKVISPCSFYTNREDAEWGDDTGVVIVIFDDKNHEVFWDEVVRYQKVNNVELSDADQDGLVDIIISVAAEEPLAAQLYVYGWKERKISRK